MKYLRGKQTWKLEEGKLGKARLYSYNEDGGEDTAENIWVIRYKDEMVLRNDSIAFMHHSWGMVLPNQDMLDISYLRKISPEEAEFETHPEAWDEMLEAGAISPEGDYIEPLDEYDESIA
jgi:hypothetical protein